MSTPQTSALLLERACCRIWRTTSLSTTRAGCAFERFALAFMIPALWDHFGSQKADPEPVVRLRAEYMRSPAHRYARRRRQAAAPPTGLSACRSTPLRPNTNATKQPLATAHRWDILRVRTERFPRAERVPLLRCMLGK